MKKTTIIGLAIAFGAVYTQSAMAKQWTLQECIDYALSHNIQLRQNVISKQSAHEDVLQSKAELFPSLSASTSQNVIYNPFPETNRQQVANGYVETSSDKVYYNGTYGVNFNWTVWNGNQNRLKIKSNKLAEQQAELDSAVTANSLQEQIAQIYVQILYTKEAIKVNEQSLEFSKANEKRAQEMEKAGSISKADVSQLTAQRASDEYNVVAQQTNLRNYTRQLKQLLQITDEEDFDVAVPSNLTGDALGDIPGLQTVYEKALTFRPEIESQKLALQSSDINIKMAKAQRMPTVSLSGGAATNVTTMSDTGYGKQMKNNFALTGGVTVSVPIFDNRQSRTAINKAKLAQQSTQLQLEQEQTNLYSTIENYWIQALNNQAKYRSALTNTESQQTSYELLSEQFRLGLKNITELRQAKENLLTAQQNELESKYLTLYDMQMLKFYEGGLIDK